MVALAHNATLPDPVEQAKAARFRALRERALRARNGDLPAHLLYRGVMYPLRPLPYPYALAGAEDA